MERNGETRWLLQAIPSFRLSVYLVGWLSAAM